ncbi:MAG: hypothetical protein AB7G80_05740 [Dongiaceae bacterium]
MTVDLPAKASAALAELSRTDRAIGLLYTALNGQFTFSIQPDTGALQMEADWSPLKNKTRALFTATPLFACIGWLSARSKISRFCPNTFIKEYVLPILGERLKTTGHTLPGQGVIILKGKNLKDIEGLLPQTHQIDAAGGVNSSGTAETFDVEKYKKEDRANIAVTINPESTEFRLRSSDGSEKTLRIHLPIEEDLEAFAAVREKNRDTNKGDIDRLEIENAILSLSPAEKTELERKLTEGLEETLLKKGIYPVKDSTKPPLPGMRRINIFPLGPHDISIKPRNQKENER